MIQQRSGESSQSPSEFNDRIVDMSGLQLLRAPGDCLERIFEAIRNPELLWLRCEINASFFPSSWSQSYETIEINSLSSCIPIKNLRVLEFVDLKLWYTMDFPVLGTLWNTEYEAPVQLRELNIGICLFELPKSIGQLKYLQKIELHHFRGTLPEEFFHLCSLKHLRLGARMESLSDSLGNFTSLQHIDLSGCARLQALPPSFGNLAMLQHIDLSQCDLLQVLPPSFGNLAMLQHIDLSHCRHLQALPPSFGKLAMLQHIDLSQCESLQALPPSFGNLAMLQHIDLSGCEKLQTLPDSIGNLKQIQYIDLSFCYNLQRLPQSFGDLTNLQKVILSCCGNLKMLPESMNLIRLKRLDLRGCSNLILTSQTLENVSTLERLDFSQCGKMKILPSQVTRQQFLKELLLESTNLKELPNDIGDLSNLKILKIDSPSLETLPHSLGKLMKLKKLSINAPIREVTFASVEKVQGGRRLLDSCIDKCMPRLKELGLCHTRITEISFGEGVCPVLEELRLEGCDELVEVGGLPTTLTELSLRGCRALKKLRGLRGLAKLRYLCMEGCIEIEDLPALGDLELDNLIDLDMKECAIGGVLPFASVENVGGDCRLLDSSIDKCMLRLRRLDLSKTRITEISFGEGVCQALKSLWLTDCGELVEVGALPTTLTYLRLDGCGALRKISGLRGLAKLESLEMERCYAVEELPGLETLISLDTMYLSRCENMERIVELAEAANPESDVFKTALVWRYRTLDRTETALEWTERASELTETASAFTDTANPESPVLKRSFSSPSAFTDTANPESPVLERSFSSPF